MTIEEIKKYTKGKKLLKDNHKDIKYFSSNDIETMRFYIITKLNGMVNDPERLFNTNNKDLLKGIQDFINYETVTRPQRTTGVKEYDPNCVGAVVGNIFEDYILKKKLQAFNGSNGWVDFIKNNDVNIYDIDFALTNTTLQGDAKIKLILPNLKNMPISGTVGLSNYQFAMYAGKCLRHEVEDVWIISRYYYNRDYNGIVIMNIKKLLEYVDIYDPKGQIVNENNCKIYWYNASKCTVVLKDNLGDKLKYSVGSKLDRIEVSDKVIHYNQTLSDISGIKEFNNYLMDNY